MKHLWKTCLTSTRDVFYESNRSMTWNKTDTIFVTPWIDDCVLDSTQAAKLSKPTQMLRAFGPPYTHTNQIGSTKYAYPERHFLYNNVIIRVVWAGWCSTSSIDLVCHQNTIVFNGGRGEFIILIGLIKRPEPIFWRLGQQTYHVQFIFEAELIQLHQRFCLCLLLHCWKLLGLLLLYNCFCLNFQVFSFALITLFTFQSKFDTSRCVCVCVLARKNPVLS